MTMTIRIQVVLPILSLLPALASSALDSDLPELDRYRATFEAGVERIEKGHSESLKALPARYAASLKTLEAKLQKSADLDGVLAVRQERKRFEEQKEVPESAVLETPSALHDLQAQYRDAPNSLELARARKLTELAQNYLGALRKAQANFTRKGEIEKAVLLKTEIERVQSDPRITAAEFLVADSDVSSGSTPSGEAPGQTAPLKRHPPDAKRFGNHWYKVLDGDISWHEAKERCEAMGGYLACVNNRMENNFLAKLSAARIRWLGGTDKDREGTWQWVSGEPFRFTAWADKQPDNGRGDEHYLVIRPSDIQEPTLRRRRTRKPLRTLEVRSAAGQWHDCGEDKWRRQVRGVRVHGFICEWNQ